MNPELDKIIAKYNKKMGPDTIIKGSALKGWVQPRATTGSLSFDVMLGGGWPLNQWNEIVGNESNGKTVMALKTIAANQHHDPDYQALWVAAEGFDVNWAETLGVDMDRTTLVMTTVMEEAFDIWLTVQEKRAVDAVVVDSLPALIPTLEDDKGIEESTVGKAALRIGQLVRKSGPAGRRSLTEADRDCLVLVINQWREKIGVMYGDPRTTPGGKSKNFKYYTRVEVARDEWLTNADKEKVGLAIKARTLKNKTAPPQRIGMVDFYFADCPPFYAGDYDTFKESVDLGLAYDVIGRRGAYYDFDGQTWQGKDALVLGMREDVELRQKLSEEVLRVVDIKARSHV